MKKRNQMRKSRRKTRTAVIFLTGIQMLECSMLPAAAQELKYEGTTQISSQDVFADLDAELVVLTVEDVYISAGSYVQESAEVLKLTDDSYQEAVDYYEAAVIYKQNELTNAQMEYDKSVVEEQYARDIAEAEAEQAEFVRAQSVKELENTIAEHEEIREELEEALAEYEEGIANGSYEKSSSSGSSFGSKNNTNKEKESETEKEKDKNKESESKSESETELEITIPESESESEQSETPDLESEFESDSEQSEGSDVIMPGDDEIETWEPETPGMEGDGPQFDQPENEAPSPEELIEAQIEEAEKTIAEQEMIRQNLQNSLEALTVLVMEQDTQYNLILKKIYETEELDEVYFCGTGSTAALLELFGKSETADPAIIEEAGNFDALLEWNPSIKTTSADTEKPVIVEDSTEEKTSEKEKQTEQEIQVTVDEVQVMTVAEPETQAPTEAQTQAPTEAQTQASPDVIEDDVPVGETLPDTDTNAAEDETSLEITIEGETQETLFAEPEGGQQSESRSESGDGGQTENGGQTGNENQSGNGGQTGNENKSENGTQIESESEAESESEDADSVRLTELQELLKKLNAMEQKRQELYTELQTLCTQIANAEEKIETLNDQKKALIAQKVSVMNEKMSEKDAEIEALEQRIAELENPDTEESETPDETLPDSTLPGGNVPGESESKFPGGNVPGESESELPGGNVPGESESEFPGGTLPDGMQPGGNTNDQSQGQNSSGTTGFPGNMSGQMPSGAAGSTGSVDMSAMSGSTMMSGQNMQGTTMMSGSMMQGMTGMNGQDSNDISLFGDTYDLTEVKNLLEREPSSTEDAEDILEQLLEWQETVQLQYEELLREEEATRLDIQYTYDSAVIAAKLAELTYQENMETLESDLQSVKDELEALQETLTTLKGMVNGVITAKTAGTAASVSYKADDLFSQATALYSVYNTDTVEVAIAVPQEEIAQFVVGDSVDVQVSGMMELEGTVSQKASEPTDGTSRTEVIYEVEISLDNSRGRMSAGLAAVVTLDTEDKTEQTGK